MRRRAGTSIRRRLSLLAAAAALSVSLAPPVDADPLDPYFGDPGTTLPNLSPDVRRVHIEQSWLLDEETNTVYEGPRMLYFDAWAMNLGTVPLQLRFGGLEDPQNAIAEQCMSWRDPDKHLCRAFEPIGGFSWHEEHTHFHFNEFADYEVRKLLPSGRVDYSPGGLVSTSEKVSFCLVDSSPIREDAAPAPFYLTCTPTVEGISPGWADTYTSDLPGQQLPLTDLVDGRYALVIKLDFLDHIHETDNSDNVVEATLEISGGVTTATIVGRNYPSRGRS